MRDKSTMSKGEFVWNTVYYGLIIYFLFLNSSLIPLGGLTRSKSIWILIIMTVVLSVVGVLLTCKKRRTTLTAIVNCLGPFLLYFLLSYWVFFKKRLVVALVVVGVLTVSYGILVLVNYFRDRTANVSFGACLRSCLLSCRTLATLGMAVAIVLLCGKTVLGIPNIESTEKADLPAKESYHTRLSLTKANLDTILLLDNEEWTKLDEAQRLDVLKVLADMETAYHGIDPVALCADPLAENELGNYDAQTRTVTVNLRYLTECDGETLAETIFHECYHAYQHEMVDIFLSVDPAYRGVRIFRDASAYAKEFEDYIHPDEDPEGYENQDCEWDSEYYARDALRDYLENAAWLLEFSITD